MVGIGWAEPDTRAIIEPKTAPFGLLLRYFEPLPSPNPLDPLYIDAPTGMA